MADDDKKPGGLMAILGVGKKPDDEDDGEPKSPKARAVKAMFDAAGEEDWDGAAKAFGRAYDVCGMKGSEDEESEEHDEDEEA